MPHIGPAEIFVILIIALLVLGPRRLPEVGRSLGSGIREFRASLTTPRKGVVADASMAEQPTAVRTETPMPPEFVESGLSDTASSTSTAHPDVREIGDDVRPQKVTAS